MFGKQKNKEEVKPTLPVDNTPDLEVPVENVGFPGFTAEPAPVEAPAPETNAPAPAPAPAQVPVQTPAPAQVVQQPAPQPEAPKHEYCIVGEEVAPEGFYKYTIVTNKYLGELGGVYQA